MTTLVDTSAWVEYLRGTGSPACEAVQLMIADDESIGTTDVVIMELLCGCKTSDQRKMMWALLNRCRMLPTRPLFDFEAAANLYVLCRKAGFTPTNTNDLLIAAVSMGKGVPLLATDLDYSRIAKVSRLQLVTTGQTSH